MPADYITINVGPLSIPKEDKVLMHKLLGIPSRRARIRQSSFAGAFSCARRHAYKERMGLEVKGFKHPRETGTIAHQVLRALYEGKNFKMATREGARVRDEIFDHLVGDGTLEASAQGLQKKLDQSLSIACALSEQYWKRFALDTERWRTIGVEVALKLKTDTLTRPLTLIIDHIAYDTKKNEIWIFDHKTTSLDPRLHQLSAAWAPQTRMYRLGVEMLLREGLLADVPPDAKVVGFCYNTIKTPTIRQKARPPQSWDEYLEEVNHWYAATGKHKNTTTGGPAAIPQPYWHRFRESTISLEFYDQLTAMDTLCGADVTLRQFPKTPDKFECTGGPGRSPCEYLDLCGSPTTHWQALVNKLYDIRPVE